MKGRALVAEGRQAEALPHFQDAAAAYPTWALAHLEEARCRMVLNQDDASIRAPLERALTLAPQNPRVHYLRGLYLESFGRESEARQAYQRAVQLRGSYADALYRLALLEEHLGELEAARDLFERARGVDPENVGTVLGSARLAESLGDVARAELLLQGLVRQYPKQLGYQRMLVDLLTRSGQPRKARRVQAAIDRANRSSERNLRPLKPSRR